MLIIIVLVFFLTICFFIVPPYSKYSESKYKEVSGNTFFQTIFDRGNYGEFLTFSYLEKLPGYHKILANVYLPKKDGSTTEIDLIMLAQSGIYVFESKNYSGWIFGDEKNKNWVQTLPNGEKNRFFNPIWQNNGHINTLKTFIHKDNDRLYKSYIIFSERCTLKKMNVTSPNVKVIKRKSLLRSIKKDIETSLNIMTREEVDQLYSKLRKYTLVDNQVKKAHVDNVRMKRL
ncbi:MAG TPA: nuclease-related domain-containing protein [Bacillus sp. (in: firmicutes)]|nr:nuclease-related domain-containing protein [Bacillus sp. (in: firmicutes)]